MGDLKKCFKCGIHKPRSEFYKHVRMSDGLLGKCKECTKSDVKKNRLQNIDRVREYDRQRGKLPHRVALSVRMTASWRAKDKRRSKCHSSVMRALKSGSIVKLPCFICGSEKTEAHHPSYDLPLAVVWLCSLHHKASHKVGP